MPKRKWNRLHDDHTIASERDHRSRSLREQQEARVAVDEGLVERLEERQTEQPAQPEPADRPQGDRRKGE